MFNEAAYENVEFDDGRGRYPDIIRAPAPLGLRTRVKRKAAEEGISSGELIRRAVFSYLGSQGEDISHAQ